MTLQSKAQDFNAQFLGLEAPGEMSLGFDFPTEGLEVEEGEFSPEGGMFDLVPSGEEIEVEDPSAEEDLEVVDELEFPGDLPGAEDSPEPEEETIEVREEESDENDAKKKKDPRWDWESRGPEGFVDWVKERFDTVPRHSGYDSAGLERAISYLDRLDHEISRAMRMDLSGNLDANSVEEIRATIEDGLDRLEERLDKVKSRRKRKGKGKKTAEIEIGFHKEAQKITGVNGVMATVPLLILRIAKICINGTVSAGHDMADTYDRLVKKFALNEREQAETLELLSNMGYPLRQDRAFLADEEIDPSSSNNFDWAANYRG